MKRAAFILSLALALSLGGCGTSRDRTDDPSPAKQIPKHISLSLCMQNPNFSSFLPHDMVYYNDSQIYDLMYNTLVTANHAGTLLPEIAAAWEIDGLDYTFLLQRGVRFHDGRPLTAADVFFTLKQLIIHASHQYKELLCIEGVSDYLSGKTADISGFQWIDDLRFKIKLRRKFNFFLHFLSAKFTSIIPDRFAGMSREEFNRRPIGTGPFELKGFQDRVIRHRLFREYRFEKNETYFAENGNVDEILFYIPTSREGLGTLLFFDIFIQDVDFDRREIERLPNRRIINTPPDVICFLALNPAAPGLQRNETRRRINRSIRRERLLQGLKLPGHIPAHSIIPATMFGYNPHHRIQPVAREKGQGKEDPISVDLLIHSGQRKIAAALRRDLADANIRVSLREVPPQEYFPAVSTRPPSENILVTGLPDYPAPYNFLNQLYEIDGVLNHFRLNSPEILDLIHTLPTLDIKEEAAALTRINALVEAESLYIPLYYSPDYIIMKDSIESLIFEYAGVIDFSSIEVDDERSD